MSASNDLAPLLVPIADLAPLPGNPRRGDVEAVKASLDRFGQYKPVVYHVRRGRRIVIAGNHTLAAATDLGWESIAATEFRGTRAEADAVALADNKTSDLSTYDDAALLALTRSIGDTELLAAASFSDLDLLLLADTVDPPSEGLTDPDAIPDPPKPITEPGDLWLLGPHRVLCGDAVSKEAVAGLVGDRFVSLMSTDPPYGVGVDHRWREEAGKSRLGPSRGAIEGDDCADWGAAYALTTAPVAYVWHAAHFSHIARAGLEQSGFEIRQQIIWVKAVFSLGRSAYQWKHEPCWYAVRKGSTAKWKGGRAQTTVWEAASPIHIFGRTGNEDSTAHPTQKPVVLSQRPIENHTEPGDFVYDPFAGSGTTMVAAQGLGRCGLLMEIDPGYVDVICRRYQEHTGDVPILERTGRQHDFTT